MADNISISKAIRALLLGGHICEIFYNGKKRNKYTVYCSSEKNTYYVGTITPSSFNDIIANDILTSIGSRTDDSGNICHYYALNRTPKSP